MFNLQRVKWLTTTAGACLVICLLFALVVIAIVTTDCRIDGPAYADTKTGEFTFLGSIDCRSVALSKEEGPRLKPKPPLR